MTAYYNEIDPYAAQWLRNLITEKLIAPGDVDERSIAEVNANDLAGYTQCHFFAGIGGWSYALRLAGWPDDKPVWTGSCPCQPFSAAGKGAGFADERHLWPSWFHLISECQPMRVFGEQVANALAWLDLVSTDLEAKGYAIGATIMGAHSIGAPHIRQRLYWVADSAGPWRCGWATLEGARSSELGRPSPHILPGPWPGDAGSSSTVLTSELCAPSYGLPGRVGLLRGYGNAIVPQVAAEFIKAAQWALTG